MKKNRRHKKEYYFLRQKKKPKNISQDLPCSLNHKEMLKGQIYSDSQRPLGEEASRQM